MKNILSKIKPEDFVIGIRPDMDEDNVWTGEIHMSIVTDKNNPLDDDDYYSQPGALFRLMAPEQQQTLFNNTGDAMADVSDDVKKRHFDNCTKADPAYGAGVAKALGM